MQQTVLPDEPGPRTAAIRAVRVWSVDALLAVAAFAALCVVVLSVAPRTAEPDDGAYRASIVAMTDGHFLTLSAAQAQSLARELDDNPAAPPNQWVQLPGGRYSARRTRLSVPGGAVRGAGHHPVGAAVLRRLACIGLFIGARRWLGRFGGAAAVGLYARPEPRWRSPGATTCRRSPTRRWSRRGPGRWYGRCSRRSQHAAAHLDRLSGFVALELATFVRYTNVVILGCAVMAVIAPGG